MRDPTLIQELLLEMEANLALLEESRSVPREEFLHDPRHYLLAERCFQLAIQCVLDICTFIAAREVWPKPDESREVLLLMGRQGVLPAEFARHLAGIAGFRNLLVHAYLRIDRDIVHQYLTRLEDFRQFARHIQSYLERQTG